MIIKAAGAAIVIEDRHPLRGFVSRLPLHHGFADSPVALCPHPLRGLIAPIRTNT